MGRHLGRTKREWDDLADIDPYWAILSNPERKHGGWDPAEFVAQGERDVGAVLEGAASLGLPERRELAVDFGCGLGRLSRALAPHYERVVGVDISRPLIERATELNADVGNCEFRVTADEGLAGLESDSADLVCSLIVLQHQGRRETIKGYVAEFVRILRPGGVAVFQLPTYIPTVRRIQPRRRLYAAGRTIGLPASFLYRLGLHPISMTYLAEGEVIRAVERAGGTVRTARDDDLAGGYPSKTYYVARLSP